MGIAPILVERIYETIAEINRQGTTILLVEQNANYALSVSQRAYVLETGVGRADRRLGQDAHEPGSPEGLPRGMMAMLALIGANALWLLYSWLLASIIASWLSGKKGYGERIGLACGLLLSAIAIVIWLVVPSKPTSDWGRKKAARRAAKPAD